MKTTDKNIIKLILAIVMVVFSFAWFTVLLFVEVPTPNKELVSAASGAWLSTGITLIYQYYFGSSQNSSDKTDFIQESNPNN